MDVSADAPYLDMAYKLVRYDGRDVLKTSPGKTTWAGPKQVYRLRDPSGRPVEDLIALRDEPPPSGAEPLLTPVMRAGELTRPHPPLDGIRDHCAAAVRGLDDTVTRLRDAASYPVRFSGRLVAHQRELEARTIPSPPPTA
jgi:nicotinate phosphoribosyltransferase